MHVHAPCMYAVYVFYATILCTYSMHLFYACIVCMYCIHVFNPPMYSMHVFYPCILSMYSMHVFYTGHLVEPQGPFGRMFRKLRIQGRMQIFEKMSQKLWNHDLRLPSYSTRRELPESSGILEKGWICVELWSFYCSKRISVPMSYISSWDIRVPEPANPSSHANFQKKLPEGFKLNSDTGKL